jgi:hypothetical protein
MVRVVRERRKRTNHPRVRGLHHGIDPDFLQPPADLPSVTLLPVACAVALRTPLGLINATPTDATTAEVLPRAQTLCWVDAYTDL